MSKKSKVPETLGNEGKRVWNLVTSKYDLRPDELLTLEDACAASDMIAGLAKAWEDEGRPLTTKGSMGQQVIHPLIGEIRTQRAARNALWRQLKLPDDPSAGSGAEPNQQRSAAQSRWASAHGKGA